MKVQILKKYLLVLIISAIASTRTLAQNPDSTNILIEDGFIEKMSHKIAIDLSLNNSYEIFEVSTEVNRFVLNPNTPNNLRIKLNYDFIAFGIQFSPNFLPGNGDVDLKGKTKSFQIGTLLLFRHWFADLSYSSIQGYYLANTDEYRPFNSGDPFIQFPDLHHDRIRLSSAYIHNSKFSYKSIIAHTERQLKSAGSFLPVFNFDYFIVDDKSDAPTSQRSKNLEFNLGPGYAHTFVYKQDYYLSLSLNTNLGYLRTDITTRTNAGNIDATQNNLIFRWDGRAGIGYNGSKLYSGAYFSLSGTRFQQENTTVSNRESRVFYHLFIGYRFKAPKFISKSTRDFKSKLPIQI